MRGAARILILAAFLFPLGAEISRAIVLEMVPVEQSLRLGETGSLDFVLRSEGAEVVGAEAVWTWKFPEAMNPIQVHDCMANSTFQQGGAQILYYPS
jgi:hypothetical protein